MFNNFGIDVCTALFTPTTLLWTADYVVVLMQKLRNPTDLSDSDQWGHSRLLAQPTAAQPNYTNY